jgi:hypothetical protein
LCVCGGVVWEREKRGVSAAADRWRAGTRALSLPLPPALCPFVSIEREGVGTEGGMGIEGYFHFTYTLHWGEGSGESGRTQGKKTENKGDTKSLSPRAPPFQRREGI